MNKLKAVFIISRPVNFVISFFAVIIGAVIASAHSLNTINILAGSLASAFACSAGNVINDIFDLEIDKINKPGRVLPANLLSVNSAKYLYTVLVIISLVLSASNGLWSIIFVSVVNIVLLLYSLYLKKIILVGNITIAILTSLAVIYGGMIAGNVRAAFIPASFALLINLLREIIKDMEDVKGDSDNSVITFPHKYGFISAKKIIFVLTFILMFATLYPFLFKIYRIEYFVVIMIVVNPVLIYFLKSLFEDDSGKNLKRLSFILKLNMLFGLIAIYLGA